MLQSFNAKITKHTIVFESLSKSLISRINIISYLGETGTVSYLVSNVIELQSEWSFTRSFLPKISNLSSLSSVLSIISANILYHIPLMNGFIQNIFRNIL